MCDTPTNKRFRLGIRLAFAVACATALALPVGPAMAKSAFYQAIDEELAGAPGTMIRQEPMRFAPAGASAYRMLSRRRVAALQSLPVTR